MDKEQRVNDKPKCTVGGVLQNGRAMCGYVIVGGVFCAASRGECNLQEGAFQGKASGVLAQTYKPSNAKASGLPG